MLNNQEQLNREFDQSTPIIIFFAMSAPQQVEMLPLLAEKTKYDFFDGDLITDNALEVLINIYRVFMNWMSSTLFDMLDETSDERIVNLADIVDEISTFTLTISEWPSKDIYDVSSLNSSEWNTLRQLSALLQQHLPTPSEVNREILRSCIDYRLHP